MTSFKEIRNRLVDVEILKKKFLVKEIYTKFLIKKIINKKLSVVDDFYNIRSFYNQRVNKKHLANLIKTKMILDSGYFLESKSKKYTFKHRFFSGAAFNLIVSFNQRFLSYKISFRSFIEGLQFLLNTKKANKFDFKKKIIVLLFQSKRGGFVGYSNGIFGFIPFIYGKNLFNPISFYFEYKKIFLSSNLFSMLTSSFDKDLFIFWSFVSVALLKLNSLKNLKKKKNKLKKNKFSKKATKKKKRNFKQLKHPFFKLPVIFIRPPSSLFKTFSFKKKTLKHFFFNSSLKKDFFAKFFYNFILEIAENIIVNELLLKNNPANKKYLGRLFFKKILLKDKLIFNEVNIESKDKNLN